MAGRQGALEGVGLNSDFWRERRVLITGHTGFMGAWLSEWLLEMGAVLAGYSLVPDTTPALFDQLSLSERMRHVIGDIRELPPLRYLMEDFHPEFVFHLAAQSLVRRSYFDPLETYATNVLGTVQVLEVCRYLDSLKALVVVTSDKCYENRGWRWGYRENEALGGDDPYSSSKACAELVTAAYRNSFFGPRPGLGPSNVNQPRGAVASARAGNALGGGDWGADRLIPDLMRAVRDGRPLEVRNPKAIRPWQHVLEALRGYLLLAERLDIDGEEFSEAWNFGPSYASCQSVEWVLEKLAKQWPTKFEWSVAAQDQPAEARYLQLDCAKAHTRLGWWPCLDLEEALKLTAEWYFVSASGGDVAQVTRKQITDYVRRVGQEHPN